MGCHLTDKRYSTFQFYVMCVFMVGTIGALFLGPLFLLEWILNKFKAAANIDDAELPEEQIRAICTEIGWRYCKTCKMPKPPRSHHCSDCRQCVLQMDHHCPWMNSVAVGIALWQELRLPLL